VAVCAFSNPVYLVGLKEIFRADTARCVRKLVRHDPKKAKISGALWWLKLEPFLEP
jgi:hypothetical protein